MSARTKKGREHRAVGVQGQRLAVPSLHRRAGTSAWSVYTHLPSAASGSQSNLGYLTDMHHCTRHFSFPSCNPEFMTRHPQDTSKHDHQSRPQTTLGQEEGTAMGSSLGRLCIKSPPLLWHFLCLAHCAVCDETQ